MRREQEKWESVPTQRNHEDRFVTQQQGLDQDQLTIGRTPISYGLSWTSPWPLIKRHSAKPNL